MNAREVVVDVLVGAGSCAVAVGAGLLGGFGVGLVVGGVLAIALGVVGALGRDG